MIKANNIYLSPISQEVLVDKEKQTKDEGAIDEHLAHKQALEYGKDLAQVYIAEKAKREELEIANLTLNAILDSTPEGLVVLDSDLNITQANPAFTQLVKKGSDECLGKPLSEIMVTEDLTSALESLTQGIKPDPVEIFLDDPPRRYQAKFAPLKTKQQAGWVISFHDISEQKRLEKQKTDFISIAAHELRTPLGQAFGFAQLLSLEHFDQLDEQGQEFLTHIDNAQQRMRRIIDELIQFTEISQGDILPAGIRNFDLSNVVDQVVSDLSYFAGQNDISVQVELESSPKMHSDPSLVHTALYPLVLNAVNFNQLGGRVKIKVSQDQDRINIQVEDNGIGIAQGELEKIFDPIYQIEDPMTRKFSGLGLGLATSKRAVQQLGGTISVESEVGKGSTFTIQLPLQISSTEEEINGLQERLEASQRQSLVYAQDVRSLYKQLQEHFVTTVASAIQAIEAKDLYTRGHTDRVAEFSLRLAKEVGFSKKELNDLETAVKIHDIGKIGVPDDVLNKPGKLTNEEYETIKSHISVGEKIMEPMDFLADITPIAFSHHERWDGKGYPHGLAGEDIPLGGRVMAVADAFDAMTSDRSYRKGMPKEKALKILAEGAGTQWDSKLAEVFIKMISEQ